MEEYLMMNFYGYYSNKKLLNSAEFQIIKPYLTFVAYIDDYFKMQNYLLSASLHMIFIIYRHQFKHI